MICAVLKHLHHVEWFVLRWKIWTTLNDLYSVELFVQGWIICTTALNGLYNVEWIFTSLQNLYDLEWLVQPRNYTALKDLYYFECFGVQWMICTTLNHLDYDQLLSISFLMSARCAYSIKYCKIFCTDLWVYFSLIWKYQEEIYAAPQQKLVI